MRKKILIGLLILFMAASATAVASDALKYKGMPVKELVWNGKSVKSKDVPVVVMDGRTMIPANMLKSVGYTITASGNKVIVVPASNKNYLNNIGILTLFSRLFTGLRELEGKLLLSTVESGGVEKSVRDDRCCKGFNGLLGAGIFDKSENVGRLLADR